VAADDLQARSARRWRASKPKVPLQSARSLVQAMLSMHGLRDSMRWLLLRLFYGDLAICWCYAIGRVWLPLPHRDRNADTHMMTIYSRYGGALGALMFGCGGKYVWVVEYSCNGIAYSARCGFYKPSPICACLWRARQVVCWKIAGTLLAKRHTYIYAHNETHASPYITVTLCGRRCMRVGTGASYAIQYAG
jgi:hypothetical protein